ncbi:MAG: 30S ribosomal protein S15 [Victivallales bacterium]|nr:30S ribosomal protein S15 [Victivallales bacterium]
METEHKQDIIKKFATKEGDTGSTEVQVAVLTEDIKNLTEHLRSNKKDHSTRRGLLAKVTRRRKLLAYLKRKNHESYLNLLKELGIRHRG